jgi:alkylation response protein AidB-like acyl-CoA dehydrogenase
VIDFTDEQRAVRDAVRRFVDEEIAPIVGELEHGDLPPYGVLRKLYATFGLDQLARDGFARALARRQRGGDDRPARRRGSGASQAALTLIPIIEISRYCPGLVTALGVSTGLAAGTIMARGAPPQMERWALDLLTLEKIGAWAITEPGSGSDALGGMRTSARKDGDGYVLNGNKTFITNGPYADTIVLYAKLDDGSGADLRHRPVLTFVLDSGMNGLEQSPPFAKMGLHSSPTGELFLTDVAAGPDRLLGHGPGHAGGGADGTSVDDGRQSARDNFVTERAGVAAMALGVIEECLSLSVRYAKDRLLWDKPIGDFQLVQLKLARMEVARLNVQNLVFRHLELAAAGRSPTLAEASAMKLYAAQAAVEVAMEAVQLFGGNGYMAEFRVEQLARDAKVFQIYAGTDEVQVTHIARDLLAR